MLVAAAFISTGQNNQSDDNKVWKPKVKPDLKVSICGEQSVTAPDRQLG